MYKEIRLRVVAILFTLVFITPSAVSLLHELFSNHTHKVCTAKNVKHFHVESPNCDVFHLQIEKPLWTCSVLLEWIPVIVKTIKISGYQCVVSNTHFLKLPGRSPPVFIV